MPSLGGRLEVGSVLPSAHGTVAGSMDGSDTTVSVHRDSVSPSTQGLRIQSSCHPTLGSDPPSTQQVLIEHLIKQGTGLGTRDREIKQSSQPLADWLLFSKLHSSSWRRIIPPHPIAFRLGRRTLIGSMCPS